MIMSEGPRIFHELLWTRFHTAPKIVQYDNGCTLLKYCHKREPLFYSNTLFTIDGFHLKGHKSCSSSFDMSLYKCTQSENSQAIEQLNRVLKRLVSNVSYMTPSNFKMVVTLFMASKNYTWRTMRNMARIDQNQMDVDEVT